MGRRILGLMLVLGLAAFPVEAQVITVTGTPRGWIGISLDVRLIQGGGQEQSVAVITEVSEGSPAEAVGILVGDRLISVNGRGWQQGFGRPAETLQPGDAVRIVVDRMDDRRTFDLRAAERPVEIAAAPVIALSATADTIVDRFYHAMDSLRIRLLGGGTAQVDVVGLRRIADSLEATVRLRAPDLRSIMVDTEEDAFPGLRGFDSLWVVDAHSPFGLLTWGQEPPDSLLVRMRDLNRRIVGLQTREEGRLRVLRSEGHRTPADDAELVRVREALADAHRQSRELQGIAQRVAADRWTDRRGFALRWTVEPDSALERTGTWRPLAPYVLGQNRAAGAEVVDLRPELAEYFGVAGGVLVVDVPAGTPAAEAGLQPGDVLTHVNGRTIQDIRGLRAGLAGGDVDLTVGLVRKGRLLEVLLHRE